MEKQEILELALTKGATEAEVYQVKSQAKLVSFEANRLKQLENSQSEGIALRLWQNNAPGLAVAYGKFKPEQLVEKALAISKLNPPEIIELTPGEKVIYPTVGKEIAQEELIQAGKNAIAQIRKIYPEVISNADLEWERETTSLTNSRGLDYEYTDISVSYSFGIELVRQADFLEIYQTSYSREDIKFNPLIEEILQRIAWANCNIFPPTGKFPVIFTPKAATMLWDTVCEALNGKRILEKSSPWSESQDKLVLSSGISLQQNPHQPPYSCPFDDEGVLTQQLTLIREGRFKQIYCNRAVGRELGLSSTGNGFRSGLGTYPQPSLVNLLVSPGEGDLNYLIKLLNKGLVVDQILGGGADISGDFSVNLDLGYWVENGAIVGRVKDTMITGNVYTALKGEVTLGADSQWHDSCYTPSVLIENLSVIGSA